MQLHPSFVDWLRLREPADASARAVELLDSVRRLPGIDETVIHDLGAGTGSMLRWLAPRLSGAQRWVLYDHDADLLLHAAAAAPAVAGDGSPVRVEIRQRDITRLTAADLGDASLITASALLDMLTLDELERLTAACVGAGSPTLFMISVTGRVKLSPVDPLDDVVAAAFNDHQRRLLGDRALLGPDAVEACVAAFTRRGANVVLRPSPWRLGADQSHLTAAWFTGWLEAACEQRPDLHERTRLYRHRRLNEVAQGRLSVVVDHVDLLAGTRW
ncbi:methyltransferase domain-containing protein [Micromonospora chersina]|uniref:methyltransferase domain-containing protein n=1 Tax=Micromonospora chersina TaxID=47854 RepID=UPI00371DFE73